MQGQAGSAHSCTHEIPWTSHIRCLAGPLGSGEVECEARDSTCFKAAALVGIPLCVVRMKPALVASGFAGTSLRSFFSVSILI